MAAPTSAHASHSSATIWLDRQESVAILTLARQPINALDQAALDSLGAAITVVERDDRIRALVIASSIDGVFCSGGDLEYWSQFTDGRHVGHAGRSLFGRIEGLAKPTIAAINGHTVGDGIGLAVACDLRIASDRAKFRLPELAYGFIPGWGTLGRLIRTIGRSRTAQLLLTGRPIDANEALAVGLVSEVVEGGELLESAAARAAAIGRAPAYAVRAAKAALRGDDEAASFEAVWGSDDWREGMAAATTRRPADFALREGR